MYDHTFLCLQSTGLDIMPQVEWAVILVPACMTILFCARKPPDIMPQVKWAVILVTILWFANTEKYGHT